MHTRRIMALAGCLITLLTALGTVLLPTGHTPADLSAVPVVSPPREVPWRVLYEAMGGDAQVAVRLSALRGLAQAPATARGLAVIHSQESRVTVHVHGLPGPAVDAPYRVLLVHNLPGPGRSAVLERGPQGDAIIDLGVLTMQGTEARLEAQVERARLQDFAVDLVVVVRAPPGGPDTVVLGGYTSLIHKLGRQASLVAAQRHTRTAEATQGWLQRLWQRLAGPSSVAADASATPEAQLQAMAFDGRQLFFNEPFAGNGRTCATCHRAERRFSIDPELIKTLPNNDPLFVAETNPVLAQLENSQLLHTRGLILVNADGFDQPPVFRAPPPLFNLEFTSPYGLEGDVETLAEFAMEAVAQHFPRTLQRLGSQQAQPGQTPDFRTPTQEELDALEAFMLTLVVPHDKKFGLDRLLRTAAQRRGHTLFFGTAKCSQCHGGDTFSNADASLVPASASANRAFDTGVAQREPDPSRRAAEAKRAFSTPQLFNVRHTAPFFHDNSVDTLRQAVAFYSDPEFNSSPAAQEVGTIFLSNSEIDDLVAFLEALTCPHDGDVNRDGQITPADALLAFKQFLGLVQLDTCQQDQADVLASSGGITPGDALCIFQQFLGLPSCLQDNVPAAILVETCDPTCTGSVGSTIPLRVRVTNASGAGLQNLNVAFQLGSTAAINTVPTAADGRARLDFKPTTPGILLVTAVVGNLTARLNLTITGGNLDIRVAPLPCACNAAVGDIIQLGVRVTDSAGNPLIGEEVEYRLDATVLARNLTDATGQFTFPFVSATPGLFIITATVRQIETTFYVVIGNRGQSVGEPVAEAGPAQEINLGRGNATATVTLDGSASRDTDGGTIVAYEWGGTPDPDDVVRPTVTLGAGVYVFTLNVRDNSGLRSAADTVTITVNEGEGPALSIPQRVPAAPNGTVSVPIGFVGNGHSIRSLKFVVTFDATLLTFDPADHTGDGIPEAVRFSVPAAFQSTVAFTNRPTTGELTLTIIDNVPPLSALPDGILVTVLFTVQATARPTVATVGFVVAPRAVFENTARQNVFGSTSDGSVLIGDRDGDGVPDDLEARLGLNPDKADTDGNGIPDGQKDFDEDKFPNVDEIKFGTDPTTPDTNGNGILDGDEDADQDGLLDRQEVGLGTNPFLPDSDSDGVADVDEVAIGTNANDPNSRPSFRVQSAVVAYVNEADSDGDGVADVDEVAAGTSATNAQARPLLRAQSAVVSYVNGADSDGDGVADVDEVAVGTSATNAQARPLLRAQSAVVSYVNGADSDGDGVADVDEVAVGTSATNAQARPSLRAQSAVVSYVNGADSDGDGVADVDEVAAGTSATNAQARPTLQVRSAIVSYLNNGP